jgi:hypothetical protein
MGGGSQKEGKMDKPAPLPRPQSADFEFYSKCFFQNAVDNYSLYRHCMPRRFDLSNLSGIFDSWFGEFDDVKAIPQLADVPYPTTTAPYTMYYHHDQHTYKSYAYISHYTANNVKNTTLNIKLANDGFIYPKDSELTIFRSTQPRHHSNVYKKLDKVHLAKFTSLINFSKAYLGSESLRVQLFYSFDEDRMDFKAFDSSNTHLGVVITFERGPCYDGQFDPDEDYWLQCEDEVVGTTVDDA